MADQPFAAAVDQDCRSGSQDDLLDSAVEAERTRLDRIGELPIWRKRVNRAAVLESLGIHRRSYAYNTAGKRHFDRFNVPLQERDTRSRLEEFPEKLERFLLGHGSKNTPQFTGGQINQSWALAAIGEHGSSLTLRGTKIRNVGWNDMAPSRNERESHSIRAARSRPDGSRLNALRSSVGASR